MASDELRALVELLRTVPFTSTDVAEGRAALEAAADGAELPPGTSVDVVDLGGVPGERVAAPGADEDRAVLYLHGGAYTRGSCATHRNLAAMIAAACGAPVYVADYRLAPEHPFPAAIDDARAALAWLSTHVAPLRTVVAGDSAGGGLALALLVAQRDADAPLPAAAVLVSPWADLTGESASFRDRAALDPVCTPDGLLAGAAMYTAGADVRDPLVSPAFADLAGLPPLYVLVGDAEILLDDSTTVASRAADAGVDVRLEVWPEMVHVFPAFAQLLPEGRDAIERIGAFIRASTSADVPA
jgi:acetyl esterase/lipase